MFEIIECNIPFLYHATIVYNEKGRDYWEDEETRAPKPEFGKYHTELHPNMYFTITEKSEYPCESADFKLLKYKTTRALKLLDIRKYNGIVTEIENNLEEFCVENLKELDGYIGRFDSISLFLKNPESCVSPDYEEIDFEIDRDFDYIAYEQYEDKLIIQWMNKLPIIEKNLPHIEPFMQKRIVEQFNADLDLSETMEDFMNDQLYYYCIDSKIPVYVPLAIELGWDINKKGDYYNDLNEKVTPLTSVLEYRSVSYVKVLLENGAIPTPEDYYACLCGHAYGDWEHIDEIIQCIELLNQYGGKFEFNQRWDSFLKEHAFPYWKEKCEFLYKFNK